MQPVVVRHRKSNSNGSRHDENNSDMNMRTIVIMIKVAIIKRDNSDGVVGCRLTLSCWAELLAS